MATDPRELHGSIAGPGGPRDRHSVVIDASRAVLLDDMTVCQVADRDLIAMVLAGRVNYTKERAEVLFVFDFDGAAAIVTELLALAMRMDETETTRLIATRLERLIQDDALGGESRG